MLTQTTAPGRLLLVPAPRLSPGGLCPWCEGRDCRSARCNALHARSVWAVCPDCDGLGWREDGDRCCFLGIIEVDPVAVDPVMLAAYRAEPGTRTGTPNGRAVADVAPVSVPPV